MQYKENIEYLTRLSANTGLTVNILGITFNQCECRHLRELMFNKDYIIWHNIEKYNKALDMRYYRIKKRIESILSLNNPYFVTLTFNDDILNNDQINRRREIQRYLKSISNNYVANIDFGKLNNREHYHAVCDLIRDKEYKLGFSDFEKINNYNVENIAKYTSKLTNHAKKGKKYRFIYSR